jgi:hypothetical protein
VPGAPGGGVPGAPGGGVRPGVAPGFPGFQPGQQPNFQAMQEMMIKNMAKNFGLRIPPYGVKWGGLTLEPADATLLDQLNLPAGKGMVITTVEAGSAAAQVGLKPHDLVVKINEQAVPGDARELLKTLGDMKADTPVELAVLRKGKEQTIKGAKLAEAALSGGPRMPGAGGGGFGGAIVPLNPAPPAIPGQPPIPGRPPVPVAPPGGGFGVGGAGAGAVGPGAQVNGEGAKISVSSENGKFTGDYKKDKLHVTIAGTVDNNQLKLAQITVDDGTETKKYDSVQNVPAAQRPIVQRLLQMLRGNARFNIPGAPVPPPGAGAFAPGSVPKR